MNGPSFFVFARVPPLPPLRVERPPPGRTPNHSPLEGESARRGRSPKSRRWGEFFLWHVPPPSQPSPVGSASSTPPQGGSESSLQNWKKPQGGVGGVGFSRILGQARGLRTGRDLGQARGLSATVISCRCANLIPRVAYRHALRLDRRLPASLFTLRVILNHFSWTASKINIRNNLLRLERDPVMEYAHVRRFELLRKIRHIIA